MLHTYHATNNQVILHQPDGMLHAFVGKGGGTQDFYDVQDASTLSARLKSFDNMEECGLCLTPFSEIRETLTLFKCGHQLCYTCAKEHDLRECPMCRCKQRNAQTLYIDIETGQRVYTSYAVL